MRVTATIQVGCPAEKAFDLLADLRNETQWNGRVESADLQSGEPIATGSRFTIVNGGSTFDTTLATYERPSRLVVEATGKPDLTITYVLASKSDGTEIAADYDFRPKGALKLVFALLAPVIRRDVPKQLASFKALCER